MNHTVPILMYHSISKTNNKLSVSIKSFNKQMNLMKKLGYQSINLSELDSVNSKNKFVITFDDGYADFFNNAYPILKKLNYKATIFIVSNFVNDSNKWDLKKNDYIKRMLMDDKQINELIKEGYEIGSHTLDHLDLTSINDSEIEKQIYQSKKNIEDKFKTCVYSFSYPFGLYNTNILNKVGKKFKFAVTTKRSRFKTNKFNNYTLPRIPINSNTGLFKFFLKITTFYEDIKFVN